MPNIHFPNLKTALDLSITKKPDSPRSASIAVSKSGQTYISGLIESDTHLLNISSEQGALALSVLSNDFEVNKIISLYENLDEKTALSPIVGKIIIDHAVRTGEKISYEIWNTTGKKVFYAEDISKVFSFYNPLPKTLDKVKSVKLSSCTAKLKKGDDVKSILKKYATEGVTRNFPTYNSASSYGTAILTKSGKIYFGGQYSAFDKRLGLHSEMTAILSSLMDKNFEITHLGIVSSKFPDTPCNSCGLCRQFIAEINAKYNLDIEIFTFALNSDSFEVYKISDYLPNVWNPIKEKNDVKKFVPKAGQTDYTNIRWAPVLNCVVKFQDRFLVVERNKKLNFYPGYWNGISGFLDDQKSLEEKIVEELYEELGLEEKNVVGIKRGEVFDQEEKKYAKSWIVHPVLVEVNTDKIKLDFEAQNYRWVNLKEAKKLKLLPGFDTVLEKLSDWI